MDFSKGEEAHLEDIIKSIKNAGVQLVMAGGSVSEMAMHFFDKYEIMVVRVTSKFETRRIALSLDATLQSRLGPPSQEEMG